MATKKDSKTAPEEVHESTPPQPEPSMSSSQATPTISIPEFVQQQIFQFFTSSEPSDLAREGGEDSTDGRDPVFDSFITGIVIPETEEQRQSWQFACLMLLSESETQDRSRFCYQPNNRGHPIVNRNEPFSPLPKQFDNYIIARPDGKVHAEKVIFEQFDKLWKQFNRRYRKPPASIVLHSWIMPCQNCTKILIENLSGLGVPVNITYTIPWRKESNKVQEQSRNNLESNGIVIDQVAYSKHLAMPSRN